MGYGVFDSVWTFVIYTIYAISPYRKIDINDGIIKKTEHFGYQKDEVFL